jgi:hypothetical protein
MAIHGQAVLAIWNGIKDEAEKAFLNWHVHEHIPERVALPGFHRGRRYVALDGYPRFFNFYEAERIEDFASEAYRAALNAPSAWTQQVVRHFTDTSRTVCHVVASWGQGEGAVVETLRLSGGDHPEQFLARLVGHILPDVARQHGVVGVHLLQGQKDLSRQETAETQLRGGPDVTADIVVLLELTDASFLPALRYIGGLSDDSLHAAGAGREIRRGSYLLQFSLGQDEEAARL